MEPQQIVRMLRRRGWKVIVWGVALAVVVGGASHYLQTAVYESAAQVLLQPNNAAGSLSSSAGGPVDLASFAASQVVVVRSIAVATAAAANIPGHPAPGAVLAKTRVVVNPTSGVLAIIARSNDPAQAQAIANAVAGAYIRDRNQAAVANLQSAVKDMDPQLNSLQRQIGELDAQIRAGGPRVGALQATREAVTSQYTTIFSQQEQLRVQIQLTRAQVVLVSAAGIPGAPVSPKPRKDAVLGGAAGVLIGLGIELLREKFDDKIETAEELEQTTGRPVLAEIPQDDGVASAISPAVIRPGEFSEAMRTLRTALQFLGVDAPLRRIVVSSAASGDGKSTVAANLAVAYAEAGFRTALVSGDLRRPRVEAMFGSPRTGLGLSILLSSATMRPGTAPEVNGNGSHGRNPESLAERNARLAEFIRLQTVRTPIENLTVIPGGPIPPNPAELLGSTQMREVLDVLASAYDVIIMDSPPALVVTDSVVLADACDGVLIVASATKSTRRDLTRLMAVYQAIDAPVLGAVLNRAPRSRGRSAYYGYYGAYYAAPQPNGKHDPKAPTNGNATIDLRDTQAEPAPEPSPQPPE